MEPASYLNIILAKYARSFNIEKERVICGRQYAAYAFFSSLGEKYVLVKKAKLWSVTAYEHVFFLVTDTCSEALLEEFQKSITEYMEPELVRHGEKYPEKDHMVTYLTFAVLTETSPDEAFLRAARKFRFDKGYLFNMRGHSEARLVVCDLEKQAVLTNPAGRELKKMYEKAFREAESGAKGFNELYGDNDERQPCSAI